MRGIVLDTNLVSEQRQARPDPNVAAWVARQDPDDLFLTATVVGELALGIASLSAGKRRSDMEAWLRILVEKRFAGRILAYNADAGLAYGRLSRAPAYEVSARASAMPRSQRSRS
jgi:toxin FitB